ncbi:DNA uptake protein ComE [Maribacter orientalis]|uniref:DNA uptake protein ComE n=1 Tax=Maribacter orientalis TaxID=228957 RepID=A0A1H7WW00_9FLAO|nr:DNA uptake protein ComE [Maribacter orientalis]
MKNLKSHFKFNKQERSGIFFLILFLIIIQVGYVVYDSYQINEKYPLNIDSNFQVRIDSLKNVALKNDTVKVYPFNPNYISDFKGYTLGMSTDEIDKLHHFRKTNKFVNSAEEFQDVTNISDSLLQVISPFFKFPEWTTKQEYKPSKVSSKKNVNPTTENVIFKDLNTTTAEELRVVNGVGEKLSARIIKFRKRLGGFLVDDQLFEVYYLDEEVAKRILKQFKVISKPNIVKININTATAYELSKLIYIQKEVAERIVNYRNLNGSIKSLNELLKIEEFPAERIDRINLYLSL